MITISPTPNSGKNYTISSIGPQCARLTEWHLRCNIQTWRKTMRNKWLFVAPVVLLAGCSRSHALYPEPRAGQSPAAQSQPAAPATRDAYGQPVGASAAPGS